jgi:hypothetical protein
MRFLLLIGGLLGFAIGLIFSWAQASAWPTSLWHACVAAYVAGLLMRWWGRAWRKNLENALKERQTLASPPDISHASTAGKS